MPEQNKPTIQIKCQGADALPIDSILEFQGGLKKLSKKNLDKLKANILRNGFIAPIFVWDDAGQYRILDGHGRLKALCSLRQDGYDIPLLPVDYIQADSEEDARKKLLSITGQYGEFDDAELKDWLEKIDAQDRDLLRLVDTEILIPREVEETQGDDEVSEDVQPITKPGDLWELGEHRVLCGDSTKSEDVDRVMDGEKADMVFTDPPYGVNVKGSKFKNHIQGDLTQVCIPFGFQLSLTITTNTARFYFCGAESNIILYSKLFEKFLNQLPRHIIWVKNNFVMKQLNYHNQYEIIYYGFKKGGGGKDFWFSGRSQDEASDVWFYKKDCSSDYLHPTQKPIFLPERALKNSTKPNDIVYDPFLGSGSTLIACEKTGRRCFGIEIEPHYCDVIMNRYKQWCIDNNRTPIIKLNGEIFNDLPSR